MRFFVLLIINLLTFSLFSYANDKDLTKTFITLEELEKLGSFVNIKEFPDGMFETTMSNKAYGQVAMKKVNETFVQNKNLMEKHPENMMLGMAYFEIFYNQQLYDKKKTIKKFKENYPDISKSLRKKIQSLYSLNEAKKSMRKSMALSHSEDIMIALDRYMLMHNFLKPAKKQEHKLLYSEKKLKKENIRFKKYFGTFKKSIEFKSEQRIDNKKFNKDVKKEIKKIKKSLDKLIKMESEGKLIYLTIDQIFDKTLNLLNKCKSDCDRKDLLVIIDSIDFANVILQDTENTFIKKKYSQDMSNIDMDGLSNEQINSLMLISNSMKKDKQFKKNKLKKSLLNLENYNFPVKEYLDKVENKGFEIKSISMTYDNIDTMKRWAMKDWANSWRGVIPKEMKDKNGNLIVFSEENIIDLKAQLALTNFEEFIDKSLLYEVSNDFQQMTNELKSSFDVSAFFNQDFSITLDNYSALIGFENFEELNDYYNKEVGRCCRFGMQNAATYARAWEKAQYHDSTSNWGDVTRGVDLINQVGSFEAGAIAASLGTDLQLVADSIAQAAVVGVSTDLEAISKGLGYDSFADAVSAYNAQYGTNYSVEEAKESLGQ